MSTAETAATMTMDEIDSNVLRHLRALVRHANRVNAGERDTGNGQDVQKFCVELGTDWGTFFFSPKTADSQSSFRREVTKCLTPERLAMVLSMGTPTMVQIHYQLWSQPTPLSLVTSDLLSKALSNSVNLTHVDLSVKIDNVRSQFCFAVHAAQFGDSLKNLPLEYLNLWGVLKDCAYAIRPIVESDNCHLKFLGFKDRFIPGDNTTNEWCANMEQCIAVVRACQKLTTLKELSIGEFKDVDSVWDDNLQEWQHRGRYEPCTDFFDQMRLLMESTECKLEKLKLAVNSRASIVPIILGLIHNESLTDFTMTDNRPHHLKNMGELTYLHWTCTQCQLTEITVCFHSENHANELTALADVMRHNFVLRRIDIRRLGLRTFWDYHLCGTIWINKSSLSEQARIHHKSIHFLCVFNANGRREMLHHGHPAKAFPGRGRQTIQFMKQVRSMQGFHKCCDDDLHLSYVYDLLRPYPPMLFASLPPHDTVARRSIHLKRNCQMLLHVRTCDNPRRVSEEVVTDKDVHGHIQKLYCDQPPAKKQATIYNRTDLSRSNNDS